MTRVSEGYQGPQAPPHPPTHLHMAESLGFKTTFVEEKKEGEIFIV